MAREVNDTDDRTSRIVKHIPSEVILVYTSGEGILRAAFTEPGSEGRLEVALWVLAGVLFLGGPVYQYRVLGVRKIPQLLICGLAFFTWILAVGGPFKEHRAWASWHTQTIGSVLLLLFPFFVSIVTGTPDPPAPPPTPDAPPAAPPGNPPTGG